MKESLAEIAASSDAAMAKARMKLVAGVREAARAGMTQTEIAAQIGKSQPEVSRLLRFHGTTPLTLRLRKASGQIRRLIHDAGESMFGFSDQWRQGRRKRTWTCCSR